MLFRIASFYEHGMKYAPSDRNTKMNTISNTGAFVAYSGAKTGYFLVYIDDPQLQRE
jgi:hypothetical protein